MKIALAQINTTVGDLAGNEAKILDSAARARAGGVDLVLFPELAVTGYPPRDLLLKKDFIAGNLAVLQRLKGRFAMVVVEQKAVPLQAPNETTIVLQNGRVRFRETRRPTTRELAALYLGERMAS